MFHTSYNQGFNNNNVPSDFTLGDNNVPSDDFMLEDIINRKKDDPNGRDP